MEVVPDPDALRRYMVHAARASGPNPVLVDKFLEHAIEIDVDAIADGTDVYIAGVMQQIEEAGVHSGDSACALPPYSLQPEVETELRRQTRLLALRLGVVGLINVQYAVQRDQIYVLEVNTRASRTVPFVAKATSVPVAKIAGRVIGGDPLARFQLTEPRLQHVAVKEAVLPFARFPGSDFVLGPEMKSTGEAMGMDRDFATAYLKAQLGAGVDLPRSGNVLLSVRDVDKPGVVDLALRVARLGFGLLATPGTAEFLRRAGVPVATVAKVGQGSPNVLDLLERSEIQLLVDTALSADEIRGNRQLRAGAVRRRVPYCSRLSGARAMVDAIERQQGPALEVRPLQAYADQRGFSDLLDRRPLVQAGDGVKKTVEQILQTVEDVALKGVQFECHGGEVTRSDPALVEAFGGRQLDSSSPGEPSDPGPRGSLEPPLAQPVRGRPPDAHQARVR
jgi:carbamoyl-phosphate synthase large subunit